MSRQDFDAAIEFWSKLDIYNASKNLFYSVPRAGRPKWAVSILRTVVGKLQLNVVAVNSLLDIGDNRAEWNMAKAIFKAIRYETLSIDASRNFAGKFKAEVEHHVLLLAEEIAKLLYNATDPDDPFDDDVGEGVVTSTKAIVDMVADREFAFKMWKMVIDIGK